ncbi:hypothetical protein Tco_1446786 [Tanacetum coccineum]
MIEKSYTTLWMLFIDNVQKGNISIEEVASEDNVTDILSLPLKRESFNYLRLEGSLLTSEVTLELGTRGVESWKNMVDKWVMATKEIIVSDAISESINSAVLNEVEEGLPSLPLDDLAFLYPHASLELSNQTTTISIESDEFKDLLQDLVKVELIQMENKAQTTPFLQPLFGQSEMRPIQSSNTPGGFSWYQLLARIHCDDEEHDGVSD